MNIVAAIQPIVKKQNQMGSFKVIGVEVLARGVSNGKIFSPQELSHCYSWAYIDLKVINSYLSRVLKDPSGHNVDKFINISPMTIDSGKLNSWIAAACSIGEVTSGDVVIEVNEMTPIDMIQKLSRAIQGTELKIALDDFGTGRACARALEAIHWDYVKVGIDEYKQPHFQSIKNDIVASGTEIVIEKVETSSQIKYLIGKGESILQGFIFGKPVTPKLTSEVVNETDPYRSANYAV